MTKLYHAPIEVVMSNGRPVRFRWRDRWHTIKTIRERSLIQAEWWKQEVNRAHYAVQCEDLEEFEIYRQGHRWFMERVWD